MIPAHKGKIRRRVSAADRIRLVTGIGRVADPAARDETVADFRALLATISESDAVAAALSPVGDGLLQLVKLSD